MSATSTPTLTAKVTDGADVVVECAVSVKEMAEGSESPLVQSLRKVQATINASLTSHIEQNRQIGDGKDAANMGDSADEEDDDESEEEVAGSVPKKLKC